MPGNEERGHSAIRPRSLANRRPMYAFLLTTVLNVNHFGALPITMADNEGETRRMRLRIIE